MDTNPPLSLTVAKTVAKALEAGGHSEKAMAEATGIPRVTLRRRLMGASPFNINEIEAIAHALGVTFQDLTDTPMDAA